MRVLRKREVADRLGVSIMTIWRWEKGNNFPRRVQLGSGSVGYLEDEIDAWLLARAERRDAA
jgi:prophage regulatory protein